MNSPELSVVIPCFNEHETVRVLVERVLAVDLDLEIILIDDGSTDGTHGVLQEFDDPRVRVLFQPCNQGKGAAVRRGFAEARGTYVIVQDADLEYNPHDYPILLQPLRKGEARVVYGSRFRNGWRGVSPLWHYLVNQILTQFFNLLNFCRLTDMETCYKVFPREFIQSIPLESDRFGFEPEVTTKILRRGVKIREVPISYHPRHFDEGKKIGWKDGVAALWHIVHFRFSSHGGIAPKELPPLDAV